MPQSKTAEPLPYQVEAIDYMTKQLSAKRCLLDASDTGVGKTYMALFVARNMGLRPLVLCPKSIIPAWEEAARQVGVSPVAVLNYEKVRTGKTDWFSWTNGRRRGEWTVPPNTLLIFDEVHRCRARTAQTTKLLVAARNLQKADVGHVGPEVLMLSATAAENPLQMYAIGYALGLFELGHYWSWAMANGVYRGRFGWEFNSRSESMQDIHKQIFPELGVRLKSGLLPGFPKNHISLSPILVSKPEEVEAAWTNLLESMEMDIPLPLVDQLRARQQIELLKVPSLAEMATNYMEEGNSVVVFLNFHASITEFCSRVSGSRGLTGKTDKTSSAAMLDEFQSNKFKVLCTQSQVGGIGVSLHDLHGRPRVSLINPSFSATDLIQCLGRIHRAGSKSPAVQLITFAAGSDTEDRIREQIKRKLDNLDSLNDGDLK